MSALSLAAHGRSRWLTVRDGDVVIMSSWPIPGNEVNVGRVIDSLARRGASVYLGGVTGTHATGHAQAGEVRTMIELTRPRAVVPTHGEFLHMQAHSKIALAAGIAPSCVLLCEDGDQVRLEPDGPRLVQGAASGRYVYIDGGELPLDKKAMRERTRLSQAGVVAVAVSVVVNAPSECTVLVTSKGWLGQADLHLEVECADEVASLLRRRLPEGIGRKKLLDLIERSVVGFAAERTRRKPLVLTQLDLIGVDNDLG